MRNGLVVISFLAAVLVTNTVAVEAQELDPRFKNPNQFLPFAPKDKTSASLASADEVSLTYCGGTLWSSMKDVVVVDTLAYCAMYSGLMIFDVSDPTEPTYVSNLYLPEGYATDLVVRSGRVYLTEWNGGTGGLLYVIDVSNPQAPFVLGSHPAPGSANGVDVAGHLAVVAYGVGNTDKGVLILDVSNPPAITQVGNFTADQQLLKVCLLGDYAIAVGGDVWIIDISQPDMPILVSRFKSILNSLYSWDLDIREGDTLIYISDRLAIWPSYASAFTILNIADPAHPSLAGQYWFMGGANGIVVIDTIAYMSCLRDGMRVFDISDPTDPDSIGIYFGADGGLAVHDTLAYLAAGMTRSFEIVNVSDPTAPVLIGDYLFPGKVTEVVASGDYAYALNSDSIGADVRVVDVTDKNNPLVLGSYSTSGEAQDAAVVDDTLLFLAAGSAGLEIINVVDPNTPTLVGQGTGGSGALDVVVSGHYAFVANSSSGLWIYDVSNPNNPVLKSTSTTPGIAVAVTLWADNTYVPWIVAMGGTGVDVINVSDPENPVVVSTFGLDSSYNAASISNGRLYLGRAGGFGIYDITHPENPLLLGLYSGAPWTRDVEPLGDYILLADGFNGIKIVDVSAPVSPYQAGLLNTPGFSYGVSVTDTYIYLADGYSFDVFAHSIPTDTNEPDPDLLPKDFVLRQNYPNPFNPVTTIEYDLRCRAHVKLTVYDILGWQVITLVDGIKPAGSHSVQWNGKDPKGNEVASGVYLYKIDTGGFVEAKKMMILK